MLKRFAPAPLCLLSLALMAAAPPRHHGALPAPAPRPLADTERVAIVTQDGTITVDLDGKHAPITTANFLRYVDAHRFDGMVFYRAMHLKWGDQPNGLVQAGLRGDPRKLFPPIAHEATTVTGIHHTAGAISMARNAPGTATADFSILLSDLSDGLDANPKSSDPEQQAGYAAFGHVAEGMDVVRQIFDAPVDPNAGEGAMKGQMLAVPVKVLTVRRVPLPAPAPAAAQP